MEANLFPRQQTLLGATSAPMSLYVATTGDDDTGEGTALNPYATVERAYSDLPARLKHECKILVEAGNYASGWPIEIAPQIEDEGSLAIVGVGVPTVSSGPHTITGAAALGTGGHVLTVGAGGLGADDGLCGQMVMVTSAGARQSFCYLVVANTDTTITIAYSDAPPQNADVANIVTPPVTIAVDSAVIAPRGIGGVKTTAPWTWKTERLVLHNLHLNFSASPESLAPMQIKGASLPTDGVRLVCVRVTFPATVYGGLTVSDAEINGGASYHGSFATDGATGIANLLLDYFPGVSFAGCARSERTMYLNRSCKVTFFATIGEVWMWDHSSPSAYVSAFGATRIRSPRMLPVNANSGVLVGRAGQIAVDADADVRLANVHVIYGTYAVRVRSGARLIIDACTCDAVGITVGAVQVGAGCQVIQDGAHASFIGASAGGDKAYSFLGDAAVKSDTWLAVNYNSVTDSKGAFITRED